jgi:hypothetical protein
MSVRPIFPENRRRPLYAAVALVLVMAAVLLAAGCVNQTTTIKNQTVQTVTTITNGPTIKIMPVTTILTKCPVSANESHWIIINPISNFTLGDVFKINGTTNLGESEKIHYYVYSAFIPTPPNVPEPNYYVTNGDAQIVKNDCKEKVWSFTLDSNNFTTWSEVFYVNIWTNNWTSSGAVKNTTMILTHRKVSDRSWGEVK